MDNLSSAAQELGKILYEEAAKKQTQADTDQTPPPETEKQEPKKGGDDVIDAEFEAKDQ